LLRVFAGPLAGITKMPYPKFLLCNAIGAATWASVMVSLTYFLGQLVPLPVIMKWTTQFAGVALVAVVGSIALAWWLESRRETKAIEL
jgi:membrane protein DedA with SNARE-associated domain